MENKTRSGFAAILGRPNVGKSTLMNRLVGQKVAITSSRAQTTRKKILTVLTRPEGQIIFLDTPGLTRADSRLGEFMNEEITGALRSADIALWVIEPSSFVGAGERKCIEVLKKNHLPVILVINKEDMAEPEKLRKTAQLYQQEAGKASLKFRRILPVCARDSRHLEELLEAIFENLPEGPLYYDPDTLTEETERDIAAEMIREKCLLYLDREVPHGVAVGIEKMREREDKNHQPVMDVEAVILCEREAHKGIIIGKNGAMLKKIGTAARKDMEEMLDCHVALKLWVKVRKGWKDNPFTLREFGYQEKR